MGQQVSQGRQNLISHRNYNAKKTEKIKQKRIDHQGILKLRSVPFKNCIEIQTNEASLFLQEAQITLKDLLDCRLYTNKLFPVQDVEKLIEHVTYTLAYMQQNGVSYKDINTEYVYYQNGSFKLLPNQLISQSIYQRFKRTISEQPAQGQAVDFPTLSPEMIIAFRCKQPRITDKQILDKSNVFCLGMMLLQVCTLLPSRECYDMETFDILDQTMTQRINLAQEYYNPKICKIIANMLDYDYSQRMDLKQSSIFVNRQFNQHSSAKKSALNSQATKNQQNESEKKSEKKSRITNQSHQQQFYEQRNPSSLSLCTHAHKEEAKKKRNRNNSIYLTSKFDQNIPERADQRSNYYLDHSRSRGSGILTQISNNTISSSQLRPICQKPVKNNEVYRKSIQTYQAKQTYKQPRPYRVEEQNQNNYRVSKQSGCEYYQKGYPEQQYRQGNPQYSDYRNQNKNNKYTYYDDQTFSRDQPQSQRKFQRDYVQEQPLNYNQNSRTEHFKKKNQSRMNLYQGQISQNGQSDRYSQYSKHSQQHASFGKPAAKFSQAQTYAKGGDHSLNRIKNQIQKSRKLIQQFKKADIPRF